MRKYDNQSGRSMIEMLGVLAIVGVLSVAGIAGYSKAMGKYKVNKVMDQVSTLAANIKTMFASTGTYDDLGSAAVVVGSSNAGDKSVSESLGLIPEDAAKTGRNGLNGNIYIGKADSGAAFAIGMTGLTKEACTTLVTSDWGGAAGFRGLKAESVAANATFSLTATTPADGDGVLFPTDSGDEAFTAAAAGCVCGTASTCAVSWVFY